MNKNIEMKDLHIMWNTQHKVRTNKKRCTWSSEL